MTALEWPANSAAPYPNCFVSVRERQKMGAAMLAGTRGASAADSFLGFMPVL